MGQCRSCPSLGCLKQQRRNEKKKNRIGEADTKSTQTHNKTDAESKTIYFSIAKPFKLSNTDRSSHDQQRNNENERGSGGCDGKCAKNHASNNIGTMMNIKLIL